MNIDRRQALVLALAGLLGPPILVQAPAMLVTGTPGAKGTLVTMDLVYGYLAPPPDQILITLE